MLAAMQQADPPRPRYVYAVLRLIDRRADLAQAATSDALGCLLRILSDLQGQGLSPWCKQLIDLSYLQVRGCFGDKKTGFGAKPGQAAGRYVIPSDERLYRIRRQVVEGNPGKHGLM